MAQPYVGEIRLFAGNFAPSGWMLCDGQLLAIADNDVLFQLIGTTFGGDGQSTFALPNLQSRVPIHMGTAQSGTTYQLGEMAGVESVTLTVQQIPAHTHPAMCRNTAGSSTADPTNGTWTHSDVSQYSTAAPDTAFGNPAILTTGVGGSQPHENMVPYLAINYIISLFGIFPSQT